MECDTFMCQFCIQNIDISGFKQIISSTSGDEDAHFVAQGTGSFSYRFWSNIFNGSDIKEAFEQAKLSLGFLSEIQHPQSDADGDALKGVFIGNGASVFTEIPLISDAQITGNRLTATVSVNQGIARVWAIISPPKYGTVAINKPVLELPSAELRHLGNNRYEGMYQITLNYSDLLIWKIDSSSKQIEKSPAACLAVGSDLKLHLTAEYGGDKYSFVLNYVAEPNEIIAWKMDTETLKKLSLK